MPTKRCVTTLIATAMSTGVIMAALTAVTPNTYHDMSPPVTTPTVAAANSMTTAISDMAISDTATSDSAQRTYHDM